MKRLVLFGFIFLGAINLFSSSLIVISIRDQMKIDGTLFLFISILLMIISIIGLMSVKYKD